MEAMYNTKTFNEIYDDSGSFLFYYKAFQNDYGDINKLDDTYVRLTWQLLSAKYGNNPMANWSEDQFKLKVWQLIFEYGPTWVKRLQVQKELRDLDITELIQGDKSIYNTALAPNQSPSTQSLEETPYISQQNVSNRKKSKMHAYDELLMLLKTDVTAEYLSKFKELFLKVVDPNRTFIYVSDVEGEE